MLTPKQVEILLKPIMPQRVSKDGKGFAHVEAYEIEAHLTRIFGFEGWDKRLTTLELVYEDETTTRAGKPAYNVCYRAVVELAISDRWGVVVKTLEDGATGEATQPSRGDAHDLAMKSAISGALKRAAKGLGDQFGLSLYNNGSMDALVKKLVLAEELAGVAPAPSAMTSPVYLLTNMSEKDPPAPTEKDGPLTDKQRTAIWAGLGAKGLVRTDAHDYVGAVVGRKISSMNDLTAVEAAKVLKELL